MVMHVVNDLVGGCGVQVVIPMASDRLDFSGKEFRAGDVGEVVEDS
jgi:hypothetical protein